MKKKVLSALLSVAMVATLLVGCGGSDAAAPAAEAAPAADAWKCACGTMATGKFCPECGAKKPAGAPLYRCDKCK